MPGSQVPAMCVETVQRGPWDLGLSGPSTFDLIAIYRGSFCPYCRGFIKQLNVRTLAFRARGIEPIAISMDDEQHARRAVREWGLETLTIGYGFSLRAAREWGVFVTSRIQEGVEVTFCEPALYLVTPQKTLYAVIIQSLPCGRPDLDNLLDGLDYLQKQGYPVRGSA